MKIELPLSVALLAAGCMLWCWQDWMSNRPSIATSNATNTDVSSANNETPHTNILRTSFQPAVSNNPQATNIVKNSASNLANSPPLATKARISVTLFDQTFHAPGHYFQKGEGQNKSRFEFQQGSGENAIQLAQVCDGRFFYSLLTAGEQRHLEFVDLNRMSEAASPNVNFISHPTNWIATGGMSSLLQHLSVAFQFETPEDAELGGIKMISLRGTWKDEPLRKMIAGLVPKYNFEPNVKWEKLPPQIPHVVEIMLGNDDFLPLFPYRISFYHFKPGTTVVEEQPMIQLEMFEVRKLESLPDDFFTIDSSNLEPIDLTERYVKRIEQLNKIAVEELETASGNPN